MINVKKQLINENKILIKINGDNRKEILGEFYRYLNNGNAVKMRAGIDILDDSGLNWIWENKSGYFRSTPADFLKTLENISLIQLLNKHNLYCPDHQIPNKLINKSKKLAQEIYDSIPEENVMKEIDLDEENV